MTTSALDNYVPCAIFALCRTAQTEVNMFEQLKLNETNRGSV